MANTGYRHYTTRKQYFVDPATGLVDLSNPTGVTEVNVDDDKYIPDELNYDACPIGTSFYMSYVPQISSSAACADGSNSTFYHDGTGTYPTIGDIISEDPSMLPVFNGQSRYFKIGDINSSVRVGTVGQIILITPC